MCKMHVVSTTLNTTAKNMGYNSTTIKTNELQGLGPTKYSIIENLKNQSKHIIVQIVKFLSH